mmetsp:Transcript_50997/g.69460  ORF Transcript_50997/g.69460 Transcript_50997/m.69460 type:complete len:147 (-) Transcript_50997:468-908(-)|eukprot:CAMPEP_0185779636 /NCGR_PEP_ID=MMETSP1174-20130828/96441_1 /TAXON_ID=35687 /ORGANISM="Dictyocha speculum, Strain CCMP1381" /LENGTH=146 /DNA_ID=CAMNT_0028468851 /DNA_START=29 /DNA_END=469 /DNA_ORIENTATION=+
MAVVSDDHAHTSLCAEGMTSCGTRSPRLITAAEVNSHNGQKGESFWAVVDGFVVDASEFVDTHPGGLRKLLSTDASGSGTTGKPFGFSFSRGRNAHFPHTGKAFQDGIACFLSGQGEGQEGSFLQPTAVSFAPYGKLIILGQLTQS